MSIYKESFIDWIPACAGMTGGGWDDGDDAALIFQGGLVNGQRLLGHTFPGIGGDPGVAGRD